MNVYENIAVFSEISHRVFHAIIAVSLVIGNIVVILVMELGQ